jgi:hypothetical protein
VVVVVVVVEASLRVSVPQLGPFMGLRGLGLRGLGLRGLGLRGLGLRGLGLCA